MKYGEPSSSQQQKYPIPQKSDHQVPNMLQLVLIDRQLLFSISFSDFDENKCKETYKMYETVIKDSKVFNEKAEKSLIKILN